MSELYGASWTRPYLLASTDASPQSSLTLKIPRHPIDRVAFACSPSTSIASDRALRATAINLIIDVRSPSEFTEDALPGAINCPVLDDTQRHEVGLRYSQDPLAAKVIGAAWVSANIASHLDPNRGGALSNLNREASILIYCWRGGLRSASLAIVMHSIGLKVSLLEGGYKAFRRRVFHELETLPAEQPFIVLAGPTGAGKTSAIRMLGEIGEQVLDLERLASHRGSVLGSEPDTPQPSQKRFESEIWLALGQFDRRRPVFVEAESAKIGQLRLPESLVAAMRQSPCIRIEPAFETRVQNLLSEYHHFIAEPSRLQAPLHALRGLQGHRRIEHWQDLIKQRDFATLAAELLNHHYDPLYRKSSLSQFSRFDTAPRLQGLDIEDLLGYGRSLMSGWSGSSAAALTRDSNPRDASH